MMGDLIRYSFKTKIKEKSLIFWSLLFSIALATAMYFSIGHIGEADFETVRAAAVCDGDNRENAFLTYIDAVEEESGIVDVSVVSEDEAMELLEEMKIAGIFYAGEEAPSLTVAGSGFEESLLQMLLTGYTEGAQTLSDAAQMHPEGTAAALQAMEDYGDVTEEVSLGGRTTNPLSQIFYALIGMACMFGCFIGLRSVNELQADLSALAARRCVSPVHRMKWIVSELVVSFGIHLANMLVLLVYMKYILRLEFTSSYVEMIPVLFVGGMTGVVMGMFITCAVKSGEGVKIGIMVGVSLAMSFCAGLMEPTVKNVIDKNVPFINRINPAALISDALYCLNVYDAPGRYVQDMAVLGAICVVLAGAAFLIVRRERYDSI